MVKNRKSKVLIPGAALSRALGLVSRGAGRDGLNTNVQVTMKDGVLTLFAFNGIMGISTQTPVEIEVEGEDIDALVNAQALGTLVGSMDGPVTIIQEARKGLKVECGSTSINLKGTMAGTLPDIDDAKAKQIAVLSGAALQNVLQVSASAHTDPAHPLYSVLFDVAAERMTAITADGVQGAMCDSLIESGVPTCFLLPLSFVSWMRNIPSGANVTIKEGKTRIIVTAIEGSNTMTMVTPKGDHQKYPNVRSLFDKVFVPGQGSQFSLEAKILHKSIRQLKAIGASSMRLFTENTNLSIQAKGEAGKFHSVIGTSNDAVDIHLNPKVIEDAVSMLDTPMVVYSAGDKPLGLLEGGLKFIFMPLMVKEEKETKDEVETSETEEEVVAA